MNWLRKAFHNLVYHSYLSVFIGLYPVCYLFSVNYIQLSFSLVIRSLLVTSLLITFLLLITQSITKQIQQSLLITNWGLLLFFGYGHVYNSLLVQPLTNVAHHRFIVPVFGILLVSGLWILLKYKGSTGWLTSINNIVGMYLLVSFCFSIALQAYQYYRNEAQTKEQLIELYGLHSYASELKLPQSPPDIYIFLLDAYSRQDELQEVFGFDNSAFLISLEQMGFYIPYCLQSNYAMTTLSIASMFQMEYLDEFGGNIFRENMHWRTFGSFIRTNNVRLTLEDLGYKTVAFETSIGWTNIPDATVYYRNPENLLATILDFKRPNSFEKLLINTTALRAARAIFPEQTIELYDGELVPANSKHEYEIMQYTMEQIPRIPETIKGPKFVYIHLLTTHWPYVVDGNGNFRYSEDSNDYIETLKYVNGKLLEIIPGLIRNSSTPPIIILQSDHGASHQTHQQRMKAFAAYYLPDQGGVGFYPSITPVNLFRQIFNNYFTGRLPLEEDKSYFSLYADPYDLVGVPNDSPECKGK